MLTSHGRFRKKEDSYTIELIENAIANHLNILIFLLARYKKKSFL